MFPCVRGPVYAHPVDWHPWFAAQEKRAGRWIMQDPQGREYGTIELVRVPMPDGTSEGRYKVMYGGEILGWATTLRLACERLHATYVRSHSAGEFKGYPNR